MVASVRDWSLYQLTTFYKTHYFLDPECQFSMVQMTMAVSPICAVNETMSVVGFASNCYLKLFVGSELPAGFSIWC